MFASVFIGREACRCEGVDQSRPNTTNFGRAPALMAKAQLARHDSGGQVTKSALII
jgi:hypothetical protein